MRKAFSVVEALVVIAIIAILAGLIIGAIRSFDGSNALSGNDADTRQSAETKKRLAEADRQIGMPDITRFTERKLAKDILELRDKEITTYCYIVNLNGELIFIGEAIGFGLPYSVQFTNPKTLVDADRFLGIHTMSDNGRVQQMPQADPNGLFMPEGLAATWIMLKGPDGQAKPVYMEPDIIVSPFPLHK